MTIKNLLLLIVIIPNLCIGQMIYEIVPLQQDIVVVNSTANAINPFQRGADRIVIPFILPDYTNGYFLRVTVVQKEKSITQKSSDLVSELISITKQGSSLASGAVLLSKLSTPPAAENIDVFIIDGDENMKNFINKKDDLWKPLYSMKNTVSCNSYFDTIPAKGYICLRNMHWDQGVQVKVELVSEIGWGKSSKQKIYNNLKERLSEAEGITEEQIKLFCSCFIKQLTSKPISEVKEMLDFEVESLLASIVNECEQSIYTD